MDVVNGTLKISLDRPSRPKSVASTVKADDVSRTVSAMSSRADAAAHLDGLRLTVGQLRELARQLEVSLAGAANKVAVRDRIVEHLVGFRLNSETIRHGTWTTQ